MITPLWLSISAGSITPNGGGTGSEAAATPSNSGWRNSATDPNLVVANERDFEVERQRLRELIDRFVGAEPAGCTKHPHFFSGPLTPVEWAALMYQRWWRSSATGGHIQFRS